MLILSLLKASNTLNGFEEFLYFANFIINIVFTF